MRSLCNRSSVTMTDLQRHGAVAPPDIVKLISQRMCGLTRWRPYLSPIERRRLAKLRCTKSPTRSTNEDEVVEPRHLLM